MQIRLFADDYSVELNAFLERLLGPVALAAVRSLHADPPSQELEYVFAGKAVKLISDGKAVFLNTFVTKVLMDLFKGIFDHIKGTRAASRYRLIVKDVE